VNVLNWPNWPPICCKNNPNPDKLDKCVNEIIFLPKSARNNFLLTKGIMT
jgi:hypothetical protein